MVVPFICATLKLACPDAGQVIEAVAELRESGVEPKRCLIQTHTTCPLLQISSLKLPSLSHWKGQTWGSKA